MRNAENIPFETSASTVEVEGKRRCVNNIDDQVDDQEGLDDPAIFNSEFGNRDRWRDDGDDHGEY